jgi:CheY-like chemotaxis protein
VIGAIHAVADDSARRVLQAQLIQSQKMEAMGRLASFVAHDFNNLLTAIIGFSELLGSELTDSRLMSYVSEVQDAAGRAGALTTQLLAFSRRRPAEAQTIQLNAVVQQTQRMLGRIIGEDIQLETILDPDLRPVNMDPGQVDQIILNLAVNARDAMPGGGRIFIRTVNHGQGENAVVRLSVTDTGIGMSSDVLTRIFEPFFTTKAEGKGTGLGLSIVYEIVKQNGGEVKVESAPGKGSTFFIDLPPAVGDVGPAAAKPESEPARTGRETVLLVEDEPVVRSLVCEILGPAGYTVLEAESGQEALRISRSYAHPIDLLLTDVVMPDIAGPQVAELVTQERPGIGVLFISGYLERSHTAINSGKVPGAFLSKPFTAAALKRKVAEALRTATQDLRSGVQR